MLVPFDILHPLPLSDLSFLYLQTCFLSYLASLNLLESYVCLIDKMFIHTLDVIVFQIRFFMLRTLSLKFL